MKVIAFVFSILVLLYLMADFINEQEELKPSKLLALSSTLELPATISNKKLAVELVWAELKAKQNKPKQLVDSSNQLKTNKDILTIGDKKYTLYGVFKANQQLTSSQASKKTGVQVAFILIKAEGEPIQKIFIGDELSADVVLLEIKQNNISFKRKNETLKFKLFERNNDE